MASMSEGGLPRSPPRMVEALVELYHFHGAGLPHGRQAEGNVADGFHKGAAQAEHAHGSEAGVVMGAYDDLHALFSHLLHQDSVDDRVLLESLWR